MKKLFFSAFVIAAASSASMAQSITVAVGAAPGMGACTSSVSSLSDSFTRPVTIQSGTAGVGKQGVGPITIVKGKDSCSIPLLTDMFKAAAVPTITITISALVGSTPQPVLVLTLTNTFVTAVTDSSAPSIAGGTPSESVTLSYESVTIKDPINNTTATCSALTLTCY